MFVSYRNIGGDSNVESYEIGADYISVKFFGTPKIYTYSYKKAGFHHVEAMKALAVAGDGLNSYINTNCKFLYD